jgi:protoporphyrin/coproporphyrin ferrochelatase
MSGKTAVLLANVGTPDAPKVSKVYPYLVQFLNDPRVIDIPWLFRKLLVNLIIIPFRVFNSTKLYKILWTKKGSPLLYHTESLAKKLNAALGGDYEVLVAMRYGKPSLKKVMETIRKRNFDELVILPMFPQYASSTTGTATDEILKRISDWNIVPSVSLINQFYNHPSYLDAFVSESEKYNLPDYEHIIFSYHGLPDSHIHRIHPEIHIRECPCEKEFPPHGTFCYKATCYQTTRLIAEKLNLPAEKYTVSFQSRLSKNWLTPFSDKVVIELAKSGKKKILVFAPSFVTDCLETVVEIGVEYKELFKENGGEVLQMADALNDSEAWVNALHEIILENTAIKK